ncbi:MAG TPA: class IV adenylate cyclase, partial [Candidatus Saccharimonadales bacterium]|nr:class IV adenylate cyclase [Candidatus Saccharimonadales bacterium]
MKGYIEFEVKFFTDHAACKQKVQNLGGLCIRKNGLMRRFVFIVAGNVNQWIRVRHEGEYVTLTIKSYDPAKQIDGVCELEIKVSDFDTTVQMLHALGYKKSLYVENYREIWKLEDCLLMFDLWPGLDPFVEIEGPSKEPVEKVADLLGLSREDALYGPNRLLY